MSVPYSTTTVYVLLMLDVYVGQQEEALLMVVAQVARESILMLCSLITN
jgi:hypothetical protein